MQDFGEWERFGRHCFAAEAATRILLIAAAVTGQRPGLIGVIAVEGTPLAQCAQQQLLVLDGDGLIELVLAYRLGEKFGDAAVEVRKYVAQALRLPAEMILGVQIRVVVDLDERFEADAGACNSPERRRGDRECATVRD